MSEPRVLLTLVRDRRGDELQLIRNDGGPWTFSIAWTNVRSGGQLKPGQRVGLTVHQARDLVGALSRALKEEP